MEKQKYQFWRALRPFSFSVAIIVSLTGVLLASRDGFSDPAIAGLVIFASLLLQAGVNLINDYADLEQLNPLQRAEWGGQIRFNSRIGLLCFLLATVIGIYLIAQSGWLLLLFAVIGFAGALGYTMEPINYKRRGLGIPLVFWLMGVMMILGSYYALSQQINLQLFLISIPISLYTSLLLLSNELRDFEDDRFNGIQTLTVRMGFRRASLLYHAGLVSIFACAVLYSLTDILPQAWLVLLSLPVALLPLRYLNRPVKERVRFTPATGRSFLVFGLLYCSSIAISQ